MASDPRESDQPSEGGDPAAPETTAEHDDALADEMSEESFPGSDPPSTWAGHDTPPRER
ncbi:hypothetical protein ABFT23_17955 [Nocardioides sp. C4-1]|uniref:hypothetical protein n=1 Tax=Nocardioides sp. C4-1 TaxID=3151851 RepID=UPI00326403AF